MDLSNPKIEISSQLRARCCRRVAQYELHIASEKIYTCIIYVILCYIMLYHDVTDYRCCM